MLIKARARELGFVVCGVARADVPLDVEYARYSAAMDAGLHGPLDYVLKNRALRERYAPPGDHPRPILDIGASAKSILRGPTATRQGLRVL